MCVCLSVKGSFDQTELLTEAVSDLKVCNWKVRLDMNTYIKMSISSILFFYFHSLLTESFLEVFTFKRPTKLHTFHLFIWQCLDYIEKVKTIISILKIKNWSHKLAK